MPVKRRRPRHRRQRWADVHVIALISGLRYLDAFGGQRRPWPEDELRAAWHDLGDAVTAAVRAACPCRRPWAWWRFVLNDEMPWRASEHRRELLARGMLDAEELRLVKADPSLLDHVGSQWSDRWPHTMEIAEKVVACQ